MQKRMPADSTLSRRSLLTSAAALFALRARSAAQDPSTFSTDVKLVNLFSAVRTKKGEYIHDLNKEDFVLLENGRPQTIQFFSRESDLPLTLGLMVDTSMSQRKILESERSASFRFLDQVLRESKDHVFIMQFDSSIQLRQPLTSSFRDLNESLSYVDTPTYNELRQQAGGGTRLYDAVVKASSDTMKNQTGRKALILLTDGVDFGSEATVADAVEAAQRSDTLIYSILFMGEYEWGSPSGRTPLVRMASETGGAFYEVSKKLNIARIFELIQQELRSQYSIGYVSDQPVRVSEFRKIQLTTNRRDLIVQARDRYWAKR
jgi:VWFA-related protein